MNNKIEIITGDTLKEKTEFINKRVRYWGEIYRIYSEGVPDLYISEEQQELMVYTEIHGSIQRKLAHRAFYGSFNNITRLEFKVKDDDFKKLS